MCLKEASQLVIQAGAMAKGGDVFILDMGRPVRIADLARNMLEAYGLRVKDKINPEGDIEIIITGMRPGDKLSEALLIGNNPEITEHPLILKANESFMREHDFKKIFAKLIQAIKYYDVLEIQKILMKAVYGYIPANEIVDWISTHANNIKEKTT